MRYARPIAAWRDIGIPGGLAVTEPDTVNSVIETAQWDHVIWLSDAPVASLQDSMSLILSDQAAASTVVQWLPSPLHGATIHVAAGATGVHLHVGSTGAHKAFDGRWQDRL